MFLSSNNETKIDDMKSSLTTILTSTDKSIKPVLFGACVQMGLFSPFSMENSSSNTSRNATLFLQVPSQQYLASLSKEERDLVCMKGVCTECFTMLRRNSSTCAVFYNHCNNKHQERGEYLRSIKSVKPNALQVRSDIVLIVCVF